MSSSSSDSDVFKIFKFNGKDFHLWKVKVEMMLAAKDLSDTIDESFTPPSSGVELQNYNRMQKRARGLIGSCLDDRPLMMISTTKTALEAWKHILKEYE